MIQLRVNGRPREVDAPPLSRLLDVLRVPLGLTGTKEGCGEGECGACTVLVDGVPVNSCLVAAGQCEGREVTTVEGLATGDALTPLQQCFIDDGGAQCGICTPGMLVAADALLRSNASPTEDDVRDAIAGNLCRCTGYQRIVDAILDAAARLRDERAATGHAGPSARARDGGAA
jgi:aerobic-type carbon monoxide dehydrogenase small subunit (CoxS/CutS family)